jgi:hypothetical protein
MLDGVPICLTLELPWKENQSQVSCIPEGEYECGWYLSPTHGETILLKNVPGRSLIMFHAGNTAKDVKGCIAVGSEFGELDGQAAIFRSRLALGKMKGKMVGYREFRLTVRRV